MRHFILSVLVMMITSTTTFSQKIMKAHLGLSLDETVEQCKSVGYVLVDKGVDYAKFFLPSDGMNLVMFSSPKSKIVWFGVIAFGEGDRKYIKNTFLATYKVIKDVHGKPYEKKRKLMRWDTGPTYIYIERGKKNVKYSVVSTSAFYQVESEY